MAKKIEFNHIRPMHKIFPRGVVGQELNSMLNAQKFFNLTLSKNIYMCPSEARAKIFEKIVLLITKSCIFRNTWVIYAIFLNSIAQFSRKIYVFFVHGRNFEPPKNPPCARACVVLFIFITQNIRCFKMGTGKREYELNVKRLFWFCCSMWPKMLVLKEFFFSLD